MSFTHNLITRRREDEEGFTLIELMVVVLIIAILIAIAIPTFLGARQRAQDRAAQSNLRNGLTAEKTFYTDGQVYSNVVATMKGIEPSLDWGGKLLFYKGSSSVGTDDMVCLETKSASGTEFALADISAGPKAGTYYAKDTAGGALCTTMTEGALSSAPFGAKW